MDYQTGLKRQLDKKTQSLRLSLGVGKEMDSSRRL